MLTRREFIKSLGIALASLAVAGCVPPQTKGDTPRDRLRRCWTRFGWLAEETRKEKGAEGNRTAGQQLTAQHQAALDELVAAGELDQTVAAQVQMAFGAAVYHVWRSNAPITCYEPMLVDYKPTSSGQLTQQAAVLAEMAQSGKLDQDTVARAQATIERDIAFLSLPTEDAQALYRSLIQASQSGGAIPSFDQVDLRITPEAASAAQFLVDLLLKDRE